MTAVISAFFASFGIIKEAKLRKFYFLPGLISIVLFGLFLTLGDVISDNVVSLLERILNIGKYNSFVLIFVKAVIWMCSVLFYFLIYKSILLVILSPILSYISERVETHLTGQEFKFGVKDNIRFLKRGLAIGFKSFIKQTIGTIITLLLGFVFPINMLIPVFVFLIQAYFTGFSFMDYILERHDMSSEESLIFLKNKRVYATLAGSIFTLLFFIPILGPFLAPVVTCVAVTKVTVDLLKKEKNLQL